MRIPSNQLEAFFEVAKVLNFSQAAKNLAITQSALSQRILNLESQLGLALFVRDPAGIRLTPTGQTLLRYCQTHESLENELLADIKSGDKHGTQGVLRIGGFSSVIWSLVVPALNDLVRQNPGIKVEACARELHELQMMLKRGEIDYAVLDKALDIAGIENHLLGTEENVMVVPTGKTSREDIFLDHDEADETTYAFFKLQGKKNEKFERSFMDDIHGLIAGVSNGWGSAIIPRHLLKHCKNVKVVEKYKPLKIPIYLHYYTQPYYSKLHQKVVGALTTGFAKE